MNEEQKESEMDESPYGTLNSKNLQELRNNTPEKFFCVKSSLYS